MTTHELATALMLCPDVPVVMNGWDDEAGIPSEVAGVGKPELLWFCPPGVALKDGVETVAVRLEDS